MKILLLNDNPVVNKLVTLSAQKTSDEVEIASNIDEIESQNCDLLIVDDSVYNDELFNELKGKLKYKKSLFICAKEMDEVASFSSVLKKPFLPTDLVELFMIYEKEVASEVEDEEIEADEEIASPEDEMADLDELDGFDELDELEKLNEEDTGESILDDEEAQKVKDLLDENEEELSFDEEALDLEEDDLLADYDMALDLEDEADADISEENSFELEDETLENEELEELETATVEELEDEIDEVVTDELRAQEGDLALDMALDLEDEADIDISHDVVDELNLEEDIEEASELEEPEELEELEELEEEAEPENVKLEDEIQNAVENLTEEELQSEVDEDTLLQIATNEIDPLADLTSKDLKVALGEEIEEESEKLPEVGNIIEDIDTPAVAELEDIMENEEVNEGENDGVASLKKLLEALNNKDVAASMKGMKISINITLGDN